MVRHLMWVVVKGLIRFKFPQIQYISTAELADWLTKPANQHPVLLDTRTPEEYNVSHLAGAQRQDPKAITFPHLKPLDCNTPIVVYCSVGYRSGAIAQRLQQAGFTHVYNLEGSIFQWANEGRSLATNRGEPAKIVHPYNEFWGRLLKLEIKATYSDRHLG